MTFMKRSNNKQKFNIKKQELQRKSGKKFKVMSLNSVLKSVKRVPLLTETNPR